MQYWRRLNSKNETAIFLERDSSSEERKVRKRKTVLARSRMLVGKRSLRLVNAVIKLFIKHAHHKNMQETFLPNPKGILRICLTHVQQDYEFQQN